MKTPPTHRLNSRPCASASASFSFLFLLIFLPVAAAAPTASTPPAAPFTRDLGEGLVYHRITTLPADLPTAEAARKQPCVLDLRFVRGDAAAGTALDAWLKFRATSRTPVLLLINAETAAPVLAPLAARLPSPGLVVIGTASPGLTPDLALKLAPAEERLAYDALAAGATVESVLNDSREKIRADADRQREVAIANAYRDAQKIKGEGDAEASRIYADAFGRDAQFAQFYRSLDAYKASFANKSDVMVLDPAGSEFFKTFRNGGNPGGGAAAPKR